MSVTEMLDQPTAALTSFVGRRHELAEARRLLGSSRVLTLVGTGGTGKTRLALRLCAEVRRTYRDGICVVMLADLRDPALLALTVAERLQLRDQSGRDALEMVIAHLADRKLLLVLDNCEHLIEECGRFVDAVTRACPKVHVLATSRQSLRVAGESSMQVPPMNATEAADLFSDRVTTAMPSFALTDESAGPIARICERLEGLPLAIELAAARVRVLSPAQIEQRLDARYRLLTHGSRDAPQRQQTLRALVDWSHELCSPEEQLLWARISVFSGGFDLEAAEHVCAGDGIEGHDILDLIASLADKSIVIAEHLGGAMRYRMLETLREYGAEQLQLQDERDAIRRRHRDWFVELAQTCRDTWEGPDQVAMVARLHREHANLRVALDFCLTSPDEVPLGFRIATCLDDYWGMRGLHTEMRRWLTQALALDGRPTPERAEALRMSGWYALLQGDPDHGLPALVEAGETAAAAGGQRAAAYVTHAWGMAACFSGDLDQAETLMTRALAEFREIGDVRGELFTLFILGMSVGLRGRPGDAEAGLAVLAECIDAATRRGEQFWRAYALWSVAQIEIVADPARAERTGREALVIQRRLDNRLAITLNVDTLAWIAERKGQHERAAVLFGAAASLYESIGGSPHNFATVGGPHDRHLAATREALGPSRFDESFANGRALTLDAALDYALDVNASRPTRHPAARSPLTRREAEVAALVAAGLTNKDIAARLVISTRTAEGHVEKILVKLGLRSRAQIAAQGPAWQADSGPL